MDCIRATEEFNPREAALIPVHLPYHPQTGERAGQWVLFGSLGLAALLLFAGYVKNAILDKGRSAVCPEPWRNPTPSPSSRTAIHPNYHVS